MKSMWLDKGTTALLFLDDGWLVYIDFKYTQFFYFIEELWWENHDSSKFIKIDFIYIGNIKESQKR